jgi:hypothetical protein
MQTEGIGRLKISKDPSGNRTRNLPSCRAVPEPTAQEQEFQSHNVCEEEFLNLLPCFANYNFKSTSQSVYNESSNEK